MSSLQPVPMGSSSALPPPLPPLPSEFLAMGPNALVEPSQVNSVLKNERSRITSLVSKTGDTVSLSKKNRQVFAAAVKDVFARGIFRWSPIQVAKLRHNMIKSCTVIKGAPLSSPELEAINSQIRTLVKINSMAKSKLPVLNSSYNKAAWTVREVSQIQIGSKEYKLEMGRNFKALIVYQKAGNEIGRGAFGVVRPVGIDLKTNIDLLQKRTIEKTEIAPQDLLREVNLTKELHDKAGGHQTGIQRAPYSVTRLEANAATSWGVLVHRYEATLLPFNLFSFSAHDTQRYGLNTSKGQMRLLEGLFTGLAATHKAGIAHKDIKPENIGIQKTPKGKYEACLADFGLAVKQGESSGPSGTPTYIGVKECSMQHNQDLTAEQRLKLEQKQDMFGLARSVLEIFDHKSPESINSLRDALNVYTIQNSMLQAEGEDVKVDGKTHPMHDPRIKQTLDAIGKEMGSEIQGLLERMLDPNPYFRPDATQAEKIWKARAR